MLVYQVFFQIIPQEKTAEVRNLYATIFETTDFKKFHERIAQHSEMLWVLAYDDQQLVGYKVGYKINTVQFYSWIGGVLESHRGQKIASELMRLQHDWCQQNNVTTIRTKTLNRWKSMLILNLRHGFDIVKTYKSENDILKIILEKKVTT